MTPDDATDLLRQVALLWHYKAAEFAEAAVISKWARFLRPFGKAEAEDALEDHWQNVKHAPSPDEWRRRILRARPRKALTLVEQSPLGYSGWFVQCRVPNPATPGHLGYWQELVYASEGQIPPQNVLWDKATALAERKSQLYGETWVVVGPATWAEMLTAGDSLAAGAGRHPVIVNLDKLKATFAAEPA